MMPLSPSSRRPGPRSFPGRATYARARALARFSSMLSPGMFSPLRGESPSPADAREGSTARLVRRPAQGADLGELARQLRPVLAGILALLKPAVMAPRHNEPGIGLVRRKGPDRRVRLHRQFRHAPVLAAIGRALDRAGRADGAVARRDKQRLGIVRLLHEA